MEFIGTCQACSARTGSKNGGTFI